MAVQDKQQVEAGEIALVEAETPSGASHGVEMSKKNVQTGVQAIEATTMAWTTKALIFAYVVLWITYCVEGMLGGVVAALNPYAAAQVFYTVGNNGLQYSLAVFVADTSNLRNRGLIWSNINGLSQRSRLALGICHICDTHTGSGASALGPPSENLLQGKETGSHAEKRQPAKHVAVICPLLFRIRCHRVASGICRLCALPLSFDLYTLQAKGWDSALVICMLAAGVSLIHYTGHFKPVCLYIGIPLNILGMGLMINFLGPNANIGFIVMCQIFLSIGSGVVVICDAIAILAAASHQHTAVCIAVLSTFASVGSAIGLTIASAIWQDILPKKQASYVPAKELENLPLIYADLKTQLSYLIGPEICTAIQHTYADTQKMLLTAGTAIWAAGVIGVLLWRNINVIGIKQTKGHVW